MSSLSEFYPITCGLGSMGYKDVLSYIAGRGLVVVSKNKDFPGNLEELSLSKEIRLDKRTHFLHGVGREYVF